MVHIFHGRPQDVCGRSPAEIRVYDYLDALGIRYDRVDHRAVSTMAECAAIERFPEPVTVCKNLFLTNAAESCFYLLMMGRDKRFSGGGVARQIGSGRLCFASAEKMEELLGVRPGAVSVMCLINDGARRVKLLVDEDVFGGEYVSCHPCVNTSSLRIATADMFGVFVPSTGHSYTAVRCG